MSCREFSALYDVLPPHTSPLMRNVPLHEDTTGHNELQAATLRVTRSPSLSHRKGTDKGTVYRSAKKAYHMALSMVHAEDSIRPTYSKGFSSSVLWAAIARQRLCRSPSGLQHASGT
jgi:hypothetical protein